MSNHKGEPTLNQPHVIHVAVADAKRFGTSLDTMIFVDYVDADLESATRVFQFSRKIEREEFARLVRWAGRNKRLLRVVPFQLLGLDITV